MLANASGGGSWGGITGSLSAQTDLQNALNSNVSTPSAMGSTVVDVTAKINTFTCPGATTTLTFSATPTDGAYFEVEFTGHATLDCTVTIPSSIDTLGQITLTTILIPATWVWVVGFRQKNGITYIENVPFAAEETETTLASAATTSLGNTISEMIAISGTVTMTSFGTATVNTKRTVRVTGASKITTGASLIVAGVPSGTTIPLQAGDSFKARTIAANTWFINLNRGAQIYLNDTWANIKVLTPATGTKAFANDLFGGTEVFYNGTRWRVVGKRCTVASNGTVYGLPTTTSTALQLLAHPAILFPAGIIGPNDTIYVQWHASHTADAGLDNVQMYLVMDTVSTGTTGDGFSQRSAVNATGSTKRTQYLRMNNSVAAQISFSAEVSSFETSSAIATYTHNFAVDQYFKFLFKQGTASTGLPQLKGYSIELIQGD